MIQFNYMGSVSQVGGGRSCVQGKRWHDVGSRMSFVHDMHMYQDDGNVLYSVYFVEWVNFL